MIGTVVARGISKTGLALRGRDPRGPGRYVSGVMGSGGSMGARGGMGPAVIISSSRSAKEGP